MRVTHWTDDQDLADGIKGPEAVDTAGEGRGMFVYPERHETEWHDRVRTVWEIPQKYLREVQRFGRGSLGTVDGLPFPPRLVVEMCSTSSTSDGSSDQNNSRLPSDETFGTMLS